MKQKQNTALAILGYLVYKNDEFTQVSEELSPRMFGRAGMYELADTIFTALSEGKQFTPSDFRDYDEKLADIALKNPATGANIESMMQRLKSSWEQVETATIYQQAARIAVEQDALSAESFIETAMEDIRRVIERKDNRIDVIKRSLEITHNMMTRVKSNEVTGVTTGYNNLNELTSGWQPKTMVVIAARPGMGKTTYTIQSCLAAARAGHPVIYFTCGDTGAEMMYQKAACVLANVGMGNLRKNYLTESDRKAIFQAYDEISALPLSIYDNSLWNGTVGGIRDICRRAAKHWEKTGLIVVDYIQQVEPERASKDRVENIRLVSAGLQKLAKQINVPLIAVSQLNRALESSSREPRLSDLRGSGDIEQDADQIFFIYETRENDMPERLLLCKKDRQGNLADPAQPTAAKMVWRETEQRYNWIYDTVYRGGGSVDAIFDNDETPF